MHRLLRATLFGLAALAACDRGGEGGGSASRTAAGEDGAYAAPIWKGNDPTPEELERARLANDWEQVVQLDPVTVQDSARNPESPEMISPRSLNDGPTHLPIFGDVGGPSVLRVQILLDRAFFSPGIMDGRWGKNSAIAVYWFQKREGLPATGRVNAATYERLAQAAGSPRELVRAHRLTAEEVEGPFTEIPDDIYEHAKLECSCYESLTEKLAEQFHVTPDLLRQLNPGVELDSLEAGAQVWVPNVRSPDARAQGTVAQLVVSKRGSYLHALDAQGRILYHFPSTLGSSYDPSPTGSFRVTKITPDPWWHYQPDILEHVPDSEAEARIPPGPNSAVGVVWMALSEPHYGIHGTRAPETIGYATSAGCVRLTNWDARFLSERISANVPVRFRDTAADARPATPAAPADSAAAPARRG